MLKKCIILSLIIGIAFFTNSMAIADIGFGESDIFPLDLSKEPTILSVAPKSGPSGTKITIVGEGFMTGFVEGTIVKIGGNVASNVTIVSTTELNVTVPQMSTGESDVIVTIPYGESATLAKGFVVGEPTPIEGDEQTVGSVTIYADEFEEQPAGRVKATDSVRIGEYISVSQGGFVLIDGVSVTGNGTVSLLTPTDSIPLFKGDFSVNATTGEVKMESLELSLLNSIAGFENPLVASLIPNAIEGTVTIKANLDLNLPGVSAAGGKGGKDSDGDGYSDEQEDANGTDKDDPDDFPQESVNASVEYVIDHEGNQSGQVDDFGIFLAGLIFNLENGTLSKSPYFVFTSGKITLPQIIIGADAHGKPIFQIGAAVELGMLDHNGSPIKGTPGPDTDVSGFFFSGAGNLQLSNPKTEIDALISIQTKYPYLREARLEIHSAAHGIPLGSTGAFLTGGVGGLKLVPNFEMELGVDLGFGVFVPNKGYPITGTPTFRVARETNMTTGEKSTIVELQGQLAMYEYIVLNGSIVYRTTGDFKGALAANIDLKLINVDGEMNIHIWKGLKDKKLHFTGDIMASVSVPKGAVLGILPGADYQVTEAGMLFGEFRRGNMDIFGIKGVVEIIGFDYAVFIDKKGNVDWGTNLDSIVLIDQVPVNAAPMRALGTLAQAQRFEFIPAAIGVDTDFAIFATKWEKGTLSVTLVKPDGTQITPEMANTDDRVTFLSDSTAQTYIIRKPEAGEWKLRIDDLDGDENYRIQVLGAKPAPSIQLATPSTQNEAGSPAYTIQWDANDPTGTATISLYYDDDNQGVDGTPIAENFDSTARSYQWDTSSVSTGEYYVYALIDDTKNMPGVSYSNGTVQIFNNTPPVTPVGLSVTPSNEALILHWQPNTELDLANYNVYHRLESDTYWLIADAGLETTYKLTNLMNERNYVVALSVSDTSNNESLLTLEIIANPTADADIQPPMPLTGLMAEIIDETVALSWSASPDADVIGYKLHYGYAEKPPYLGSDAQEGISPIYVAGKTTFSISGLTPGTRYYFALTAVDASGNESVLSQVASANFISAIDSDGDGLLDDWEIAHFSSLTTVNASDSDYDSDGLSNIAEYEAGASPVRPDTDADRVIDGKDPNPNSKTDSDGDFMSDDWEAVHNLSKAEGDEDGDGATNLAEYIWHTNPNAPDTDGDGATDFEEIQAKTDPNDPRSLPVSAIPVQVFEDTFDILDLNNWQVNAPNLWTIKDGALTNTSATNCSIWRNIPSANRVTIEGAFKITAGRNFVMGISWGDSPFWGKWIASYHVIVLGNPVYSNVALKLHDESQEVTNAPFNFTLNDWWAFEINIASDWTLSATFWRRGESKPSIPSILYSPPSSEVPNAVKDTTPKFYIGTDNGRMGELYHFDYIKASGVSDEQATPAWDVNSDGTVDISDLVLIGSHLGETGEGITGDINSDGKVDISDLVLVVSHFGFVVANDTE